MKATTENQKDHVQWMAVSELRYLNFRKRAAPFFMVARSLLIIYMRILSIVS